MITEKDPDSAMARNYMQRMEYLSKEYELTKQGNLPRSRFVSDFYKAHNIHRQNFLKYYHRYKESNNPTSFLPRKHGTKLEEDFIEETVFETKEELEEELFQYMVYYNEYRPHQGIDGMKPAELCNKRLGNNE